MAGSSCLGIALAIAASGCMHQSPIDDSARSRAQATQRAATLCEGFTPELLDRTLSEDPSRVVDAEPITEFGGKPRTLRTIGVRMRLRDAHVPGAASVERLLSCQAARYAAGILPGEHDPLAVEGVELRAHRSGDHYEVVLRADDERAAAEAARRARRLATLE